MGSCGPPDMRHRGGHIASGIFLPNIDHLHLIMGAIRQTHTEGQGHNSYKVCVCVTSVLSNSFETPWIVVH